MPQKILICGFPHSGTSILKSILGHIEDVEEIQEECKMINKSSNKQYILCKWPFTDNAFFSKEYNDYIKIIIIRNPIFVFSSLNMRFNYKIPSDHSFNEYVNTIKKFINYRTNFTKNIYTIRYEDLFENDFYKIKEIINNIGMKYDDSIFENTKYRNVITTGVKLVDKKPKNTDHALYRTWQINQPFISNNDISKLNLSEIQKEQLMDSNILQLYPDIRSTFYMNK